MFMKVEKAYNISDGTQSHNIEREADSDTFVCVFFYIRIKLHQLSICVSR